MAIDEIGMQNNHSLNKDFYIKNGLIFGVVGIIYSLITYLMGIEFMSSNWNSLINFLLIFGLMYYIGKEARTALGGTIPFGKAFKSIWLASVIGAFLFVLFQFVLNTLIDPTLMDRVMDYAMQKQVAELEAQGMSDEQIDQVLAMTGTIKEYMAMRYSLWGFIAEYIVSAILLAIPALIVGAIIKKEPPIPFSVDE